MVRTLLFNGLVAGAFTGLVVAALQLLLLQPLIVEAERYEAGVIDLYAGAQEAAGLPDGPVATHDHRGPGLDLTRNFLTVGFFVIMWSGFGLIAAALHQTVCQFSGRRPGQWVAIGAAGFAAFAIAPAAGLPPEMPGMPAADLGQRQIWWVLAAAATLGAAAMLLISRNLWVWLAGAILIALPHVVGAPHLVEVRLPVVPPELAASYASRVIAVGFVGWVVLTFALSFVEERMADTVT